ncbi:hypothetical protein BKA81DRAFT_202616 [Phyllosticta paracitricarpa]
MAGKNLSKGETLFAPRSRRRRLAPPALGCHRHTLLTTNGPRKSPVRIPGQGTPSIRCGRTLQPRTQRIRLGCLCSLVLAVRSKPQAALTGGPNQGDGAFCAQTIDDRAMRRRPRRGNFFYILPIGTRNLSLIRVTQIPSLRTGILLGDQDSFCRPGMFGSTSIVHCCLFRTLASSQPLGLCPGKDLKSSSTLQSVGPTLFIASWHMRARGIGKNKQMEHLDTSACKKRALLSLASALRGLFGSHSQFISMLACCRPAGRGAVSRQVGCTRTRQKSVGQNTLGLVQAADS